MRCMLASSIVRHLKEGGPAQPAAVPCSDFLRRHFGGSKVGGVLVLIAEDGGEVEVICAHTAQSMAYGLHSSAQDEAFAAVARMPAGVSTSPVRCNVECQMVSTTPDRQGPPSEN